MEKLNFVNLIRWCIQLPLLAASIEEDGIFSEMLRLLQVAVDAAFILASLELFNNVIIQKRALPIGEP